MMKKIVLSGCLIIIAIGTFAQIAYYDAVELSKYIDRQASPPVFKNDTESLTAISEILLKYCQGFDGEPGIQDIISALKTPSPENINYNPFLSPYLDIQLYQDFRNISAKSLLSSAGNFNVTNFADGLAKFLVERSKEELNVAFFRQFQDFIGKYPEMQILFPTTQNFLKEIVSYQYTAMLPALKAAFQKDLNAFTTNLLNLRYRNNYEGYDTDSVIKNRADNIIAFFQTPAGRSVAGAVLVADGLVKGDHAANIISNLAGDDICREFPDENFSNLIRMADIVSQSFRSTDEGRVWVTKQQVGVLVKDEIAFKIYLGLIYATDQKNTIKVQFTKDGSKISLKEIFTNISTNWISAESVDFRSNIVLVANTMSEVAENAENILAARQQGDQASMLVFADYTSSMAGLLKQSAGFITIVSGSNSYPSYPEILTFCDVIDDAADACYDLKSQNYNALVLHLSSILADILGSNYDFKDQFIKYGTFMASIVEADNSDEVKAAIEAAVLPVGSSSIKRETDFNISLNAYLGPYGGAEYLPALKEDQWAPALGITAPVGVAVSWGNFGKGKTGCQGKVSGGKSLTLFIPVIDIGSMASFRVGNDSSEVASEVKLANIISPGLYLYYGFGKSPISIGLGGQIGPQLREVTASDINIDKNYYFRFGFNIVVDIPFFNLYTKN